jgi:short-subunit dehydrogenase
VITLVVLISGLLTKTGLNQELKLHYKAPNVMTTSVHPNWVKTPLIKPYEAALRAAGQPIIEAQAVADVVVQQIVSAQGGQLFLPTSISTISLLRALPNWFQESLRATVSKAVLPSV